MARTRILEPSQCRQDYWLSGYPTAMNDFVTSLDMEEAPAEETALSENTAIIVEETMSQREAEMYIMLRQLRCRQSQSLACPVRIIVGQAGVVLECPTCGWISQTYPDLQPG